MKGCKEVQSQAANSYPHFQAWQELELSGHFPNKPRDNALADSFQLRFTHFSRSQQYI
jgi:hypothetical protein